MSSRPCRVRTNGVDAASPRKRTRPEPNAIVPSSFPDALVFGDGGNVTFELSETQRRLWLHHSIAAQRAVHFFDPFPQYRKLGVIRRRLAVHGDITLKTKKKKKSASVASEIQQMPLLGKKKHVPSPLSKSLALKLARADALRNEIARTDAELAMDAEQNKIDWSHAAKRGVTLPFWDDHGEVIHLLQDDPHVISVTRLLSLVESQILVDEENSSSFKTLYGGQQKILVDTLTVLKALKDLQLPSEDFYNVPLVICYPKFRDGVLEIGVYMSRLLFEIMTYKTLQCIVAALDEDTITIAQHLDYPRPSPTPVFASDDRRIVYEMEDHNRDVTIEGATDETDSLYAFSNAGFLRLCESQGNDTSQWNEIEAKIRPSFLMEPMLHQIHGVCWMKTMESIEGGLNSILWEKRLFPDGGSFYYSPALGQLRLFLGKSPDLMPPIVKGGLLCDEMGLGKTIETLALIVATLDELKKESEGRENHTHATLIVVPPALVSQWLSEIEKATGGTLAIEFFNHKTNKFEKKSAIIGEADIVVTTYCSLEKHSKAAADPSRILKSISWGRVVLDEMQEIRSSTTYLAKNCEELKCNRRWMLSGTPLFDGIDDLRGELCFIGLEPFAGNCDDGFFDFAVKRRWESESHEGLETLRVLSLVMLRRSKSMSVIESGLPLLGLKPLTVVYEPVPQEPSERAVYCYLEYVVHALLQDDKDDATKHRALLRLLRETCVSPVLLSGGLACPSQLAIINRLIVELNRKELAQQDVSLATSSGKTISCEDAIRFLSQVVETARVGSDYVSGQTFGAGGGANRRDRAVDTPEMQLKDTQIRLAAVRRRLCVNKSRRARANWYRLLELVTTGNLSSAVMGNVSAKYRCIWHWRHAMRGLCVGKPDNSLPELLIRGWRPGTQFYSSSASMRARRRWQWALSKVIGGCLPMKAAERNGLTPSCRRAHALWKWRFLFATIGKDWLVPFRLKRVLVPALALKWLNEKWTFPWAHPHCVLLSSIPLQVGAKDIYATVNCSSQRKGSTRIIPLSRPENVLTTTWSAYVQFDLKSHYEAMQRVVKHQDGLKVETDASIPLIEREIATAANAVETAAAEFTVYACTRNQSTLKKAEKSLRLAKLGLRVIGHEHCRSPHISCSRSVPDLRDSGPRSARTLLSRLDKLLDQLSAEISLVTSEKADLERKVGRLQSIVEIGQVAIIRANSAFETLQLLKNGENLKTQCPVCLGPLGDDESSDGLVSVTPCGHIFCRGCLRDYFAERAVVRPPCIACRKPLQPTEIKIVDPRLTSEADHIEARRSAASAQIQRAANLLEESSGLLPADIWEALYLAMDLPEDAHRSAHPLYTAIPSLVLAHLYKATGMSRDSGPYSIVADAGQLTSKIRALLADLPKAERSVVFTSSKQGVKLIVSVLKMQGIGCRCLFNGQEEEKSEHAIEEWKNSDNVPVLVIQAGAAACGLTLTAASKMFLLEPFSKHEEEKQAYARLHRYGQTREVHCKVYFSPVSVESRLMEWRKRQTGSSRAGKSTVHGTETVLYAPLRNDASDLSSGDDVNRFLLGIDQHTMFDVTETLTDNFSDDE